jgi:hypothetical protein
MLRTIDCSHTTQEEVSEALTQIIHSESPVVFRGGLEWKTLLEWERFLEEVMGWTMDRRHFKKNVAQADRVDDTYSQDMQWWEISYQPELANSYAFSKTRQPLHTDYAWFHDGAEIDVDAMHKQAKSGGEQMFYPLSRIMTDLQTKSPALLDALLNTPVRIAKGDGQDANVTPIIKTIETDNGPDLKIFWNYYRTDKSEPEAEHLAESFFKFLEGQEATASVERNRCETGDCFALNDCRQLHGRQAFEATEPFERILYQSGWWHDR